MGKQPIFQFELDTLLASLEYRGNDAAGIALQKDSGEIVVHKSQGAAWSFVHSDSYKRFLKENLDESVQIALVHTRKATKGWPSKNENNHPLCSGGAAIVHNGVIVNDDALFRELDLERGAETDSDLIRAIIDKEGITKDAIKRLRRLNGSVAAACIDPRYPGELLLLRSGNPLVVAATDEKIFWASDRRAIYRATKPWVRRFGIVMQIPGSDIAFINMNENSAWLLGPKGFRSHEEFEACGMVQRGYHSYPATYDGSYKQRHERWQADAAKVVVTKTQSVAPKLVYCPNHDCKNDKQERTLLELDTEQRNLPLYKLQCGRCKTNLALAEVERTYLGD